MGTSDTARGVHAEQPSITLCNRLESLLSQGVTVRDARFVRDAQGSVPMADLQWKTVYDDELVSHDAKENGNEFRVSQLSNGHWAAGIKTPGQMSFHVIYVGQSEREALEVCDEFRI